MSDIYHYEDGAIHNDNKRIIHIDSVNGGNVGSLISAFLKENAEDANAEEIPQASAPIDAPKSHVKKKSTGRRAEVLFAERRQDMAELFVEFLREHKRLSTVVDTTQDNYINKAFVAFYKQVGRSLRLSVQVNGNACYTFLRDACELNFAVDKKTYANFIRGYISSQDKGKLQEVELAMETFLLGKNMK